MRDMQYHAARGLDEACELVARYGEDGKVIAGGQSLMVLLRHRIISPGHLVDVKPLAALDGIQVEDRIVENGSVRIGAVTTHRSVERSELVRERVPLLAEATRTVGSFQIRNWGTLGGSLAHADPAGDAAPVLLVLGASFELTSSRGRRVVPADQFFTGYLETALQPDELLTSIQVPAQPAGAGAVYRKEVVRAGDMALVGVAALVELARGRCRRARVALASAAPTPLRVPDVERLIEGQVLSDELFAEAGKLAADQSDPIADISLSADYKRRLIRVLVRRTLAEAAARASDTQEAQR